MHKALSAKPKPKPIWKARLDVLYKVKVNDQDKCNWMVFSGWSWYLQPSDPIPLYLLCQVSKVVAILNLNSKGTTKKNCGAAEKILQPYRYRCVTNQVQPDSTLKAVTTWSLIHPVWTKRRGGKTYAALSTSHSSSFRMFTLLPLVLSPSVSAHLFFFLPQQSDR